jgi:hypothetical protein
MEEAMKYSVLVDCENSDWPEDRRRLNRKNKMPLCGCVDVVFFIA